MPTQSQRVVCPYCDKPAELVGGAALYPHRPDLARKSFWRCAACEAWVGCHPRNRKRNEDGTRPLGRLADAELRRAKQRAHAAFDPLWRSGRFGRAEAYAWLSGRIGLSGANCHIGMMDVGACNAVVAAVKELTGVSHD